jgi:hypothetical protein
MINDAPKIRNALKRVWPKEEVPIYLCAFHIIKNWKNHILLKVPNMENLQNLMYQALYGFLYTSIEYKE